LEDGPRLEELGYSITCKQDVSAVLGAALE
jgi:hypothetical protein